MRTRHSQVNTDPIKIQSPPPYILVGHSFGTMYVRYFYEKFSDTVVGMVLIDATPESLVEDPDDLPSEMMNAFQIALLKIDTYANENKISLEKVAGKSIDEINDYLQKSPAEHPEVVRGIQGQKIGYSEDGLNLESEIEKKDQKNMLEIIRKNNRPFGDKPLSILVAGENDTIKAIESLRPKKNLIEAVIDPKQLASFQSIFEIDHEKSFEKLTEERKKMCQFSTNCRVMIADKSGHNIQLEQPELVIDAVRQMIGR